jgi:TRAP transporter 4TM/12TM fusion protein
MINYVENGVKSLIEWIKETPLAPIYVILTAYVLYSFFLPLPPLQGRALFLLIVFFALFLKPRQADSSKLLRIGDFLFTIISIIVFSYVIIFHEDISFSVGEPTDAGIIVSILGIIIAIEGTRRGMGKALAIVICIFLTYFIFGHHIPVGYGYHVEFDIPEIVNAIFLDIELDGIFGLSTYVFFKYIFLFFLYGNLLMATNASSFIMDFIRAVVGTRRGGAAMASVTGSGALGSISGMAMGNVMITGVITIPLMKRTGFKPWVAAGVEAAASSGGQIMPPVMGAVSFLMMAFLGISYMEIIKAAIIPALLYYLAILFSVYFYSIRVGAKRIEKSEVPNLKEVIKRREAFTFLASFTVLLALIILKFSPMYSVIWAIAVAFIVSFFTPSRLNLKKMLGVIQDTGNSFVGLGAAGAGLGVVICATLQTGFAFRITSLLIEWTGGQLIPTLFAVFIACFFLGMGLPPIIVYVVSVLLGAPALIELGIPPMGAHLFCFYAAICCELSPPIATAAYVASMVAETNFWKTCMFSMMFGAAAHILPFAFALDKSLLLMGTISSTIWAITTATAGILFMSWGIAGPFKGIFDAISRLLILSGGLLLIFSGYWNWNAAIGFGAALTGVAVLMTGKKLEYQNQQAR